MPDHSDLPPGGDGRRSAASPAAVAVIGGGPAGLMAAEVMGAAGRPVTVYDRMPSVGRKFLLAGRGGLNLTHSEAIDPFLDRYGAARDRLAPIVAAFPPARLRAWCEGLGEATVVGSSGRVFPQGWKASPLLRAWLARLRAHGVRFALRHRFEGWDEAGRLRFATPDGTLAVEPAATVLALGGASWPRLGSDGAWTGPLAAAGLGIAPLRPANMGVRIAWSAVFRTRFEGEPLKRIALLAAGRTVRGEAVVTAAGLEGGAVYALSGLLREAVAAEGGAVLAVDLRPDLDAATLARKLAAARESQSVANRLRKAAGLSPVAIGLLREAHGLAPPADPAALAAAIKAAPLLVTGVQDLDRAISSAGGIRLDELDARLMLRRRPGVFAAGEMLDWEAPTGGYLLQACLATGQAAGRGVLARLAESGARPSGPPPSR